MDGAQKISCAELEILFDFVLNISPLNFLLRFFQQQEAPRFLAHFKGKFIIHKVQNIYSIVLLFGESFLLDGNFGGDYGPVITVYICCGSILSSV